MDRISDSGSDDMGSNPVGVTIRDKSLKLASCPFLFSSKALLVLQTKCGISLSWYERSFLSLL